MMNDLFKDLDIFDKTKEDDLNVTHKQSILLSKILLLITAVIFAFQFLFIIRPKLIRDLDNEIYNIDVQDTINVSLEIHVRMPCYFLHLDVLDRIGQQKLDINNTVKFHRISKNGNDLGIATNSEGNVCHPCFGFLPEGACCNSCEEMKLLHILENKEFSAQSLPQCNSGDVNVDTNESCKLSGKISLNKVHGNFHIGLGANVRGIRAHAHVMSEKLPNWDLSHEIKYLRIGDEVPLTYNPLKGTKFNQPKDFPIHHRYHLLVTPVAYKKYNKVAAKGYDYTVLPVKLRASTYDQPGIYFFYSFTPYGVTVTSTRRSIPHIIASLSGLLTGIYSLATLFDSFMSRRFTKQTSIQAHE